MHGAAHWVAFRVRLGGGTVVVQDHHPDHLDPVDIWSVDIWSVDIWSVDIWSVDIWSVDIWSVVDREDLNFLLIVGDAFARPLSDEVDEGTYDLAGLTVLLSGGAALSVPLKEGDHATDEELLGAAATHIARDKLPNAIMRVDEIVWSPSGRADYRWDRSVVQPH